MRSEIRREIDAIVPGDSDELETKQEVLRWVDSGAELCRLEKPATPAKHLVSYFVLVDGDYVLLVDHIIAMLWLPTGGHVEPDEHPRAAAVREAKEELRINAEFLDEAPLFITSTVVSGRTAVHTDVSLWYLLRGNRSQPLEFDGSEFESVRWFQRDAIPLERSDPEMPRFLKKLSRHLPTL